MNSDKISLKSLLESILAYQDDLARLYEQAAKEGSDRTHFQSLRQLSSLNAQHATELKEILVSQAQTLDLQLSQKPEVLRPPAQEEAGDDEQSLIAKAFLAEKALQATCGNLLQTAQLPPSIRNILERQVQASQQAHTLLQGFL
jgi:hypothetical protein